MGEIICKCQRAKNAQGENNHEMLVCKILESCVFFHDQNFENAVPDLPSSILDLILWKLHKRLTTLSRYKLYPDRINIIYPLQKSD